MKSILFSCVFLLLGLSGILPVGLSQTQEIDYLDEHRTSLNINNNNNFKGFHPLEKALDSHQVFLLGELHRKTFNYKIQMKMVRYFHQRAGVRHILLEYGHSMGVMVNRYLDSGDSEVLEQIRFLTYAEDDFFNFLKQLYRFNSHLPEEDRIHVAGIDLEAQPAVALHVLHSWLPDQPPPPGLDSIIHVLQTFNKKKQFSFREALALHQGILDLARNKPGELRKYLGDQAENWSKVLTSMAVRNEYILQRKADPRKAMHYRENYLLKHFQELLAQFPNEKFFGQIGQLHVLNEPIEGWADLGMWESLAHRLQTQEKVAVCSMVYFYKEGYTKLDGALFGQSMVDGLIKNSIQHVNLYDLTAPDCPYPGNARKFHYIIVNGYRQEEL